METTTIKDEDIQDIDIENVIDSNGQIGCHITITIAGHKHVISGITENIEHFAKIIDETCKSLGLTQRQCAILQQVLFIKIFLRKLLK